MKQQIDAKELANLSFKIGAIHLNTKDPFKWSSGLRMPIYNDNRMHMAHPENRELILSLAQEKIANERIGFNAVLAIPSGGIWLAALIAYWHEVPLIIPNEDHFLVFELELEHPVTMALRYDAIIASYPRALPQATLFAYENDIPLLYIRPEAKAHGVGKQIEGDTMGIRTVFVKTHDGDMSEKSALTALDQEGLVLFSKDSSTDKVATNYTAFPDGMRALSIEDLISTGGSSLKYIKKAQNAGLVINDCISIFSYEMKSAQTSFAEAEINKYPLLTFDAMLEQAIAQGYIAAEEKETLLDWRTDPENWGAKNGFPKIEKQTTT